MSEFNVVLNNHSGRIYDIPKQLQQTIVYDAKRI